MGRALTRGPIREDTQMTNRHKKYAPYHMSLRKSNKTMRYYYMLIIMTKSRTLISPDGATGDHSLLVKGKMAQAL